MSIVENYASIVENYDKPTENCGKLSKQSMTFPHFVENLWKTYVATRKIQTMIR